jgi:hypothetical protein
MSTLYISTANDLYTLLMTSTSNLDKTIIQTANIDMTGYTSESIAHNVGPQPYDFSGTYDGQGYTITIGNVVSTYNGLFDSVSSGANPLKGIIKNVNVIYNNNIIVTVTGATAQSWGGLVGIVDVGKILNCSVRTNGKINITSGQADASHGVFCGFMGQNSVVTDSQLIINNDITISGIDNNSIGLFCGFSSDSALSNCSITSSSSSYNISLTVNNSDTTPGNYSNISLFCGYFGTVFTSLNQPLLSNISVDINNSSDNTIRLSSSGSGTTYIGWICGTLDGDSTAGTTDANNCIININRNPRLEGTLNNIFGQLLDNTSVTLCQFNYTTTTNNTSIPLTISPVPSPAVPVIYTNSYTNIYNLASGGNYYIPNTTATILLGSQSISLESQTSPAGIKINGLLQNTDTTFSASTSNYNYTIIVKGVGSMYFGFNYIGIPNNIIETPVECICQVNSCATNPQNGITANSRITNIREDKTIRVSVDREIMRNSIVYPKFKSYSDYMKYLQAGLKY